MSWNIWITNPHNPTGGGEKQFVLIYFGISLVYEFMKGGGGRMGRGGGGGGGKFSGQI